MENLVVHTHITSSTFLKRLGKHIIKQKAEPEREEEKIMRAVRYQRNCCFIHPFPLLHLSTMYKHLCVSVYALYVYMCVCVYMSCITFAWINGQQFMWYVVIRHWRSQDKCVQLTLHAINGCHGPQGGQARSSFAYWSVAMDGWFSYDVQTRYLWS